MNSVVWALLLKYRGKCWCNLSLISLIWIVRLYLPQQIYVFILLSLADLIVWFMHKPVYSSGRRLLSGSHKEVVLAPVTKW